MAYTIAKYLRISLEDGGMESDSIDNQRALLDDFIGRTPELAGCRIIEELDDGWTGTNFSRPGVQKLIEMAQSGEIQCIIVKDLSRWGRNYLEVGDYLEQKLPAWGVRFISLNDNYDSAALNGATGGIDFAFRNLLYELYSQDISQKVRSGKKSLSKSGKYINALAFYGYIKDSNDKRRLVADPPAAAVVRRIFALAAQLYTPSQIAQMLNAENTATPQGRKTELGFRRTWTSRGSMLWYGSAVFAIIRDERYTGKLIYGKKSIVGVGTKKAAAVPENEWVVVPGAIPAIITEQQFKAANAGIVKRGKAERKQQKSGLPFSEKLKCGHCGAAVKPVSGKTGVKYHCNTSRVADYGCSRVAWIYETDIAAVVLYALRLQTALSGGEMRERGRLDPSVEGLKDEIVRLQRLIGKSNTVKLDLWEKYHTGLLSGESFQRENEKTDGLIQKYMVRITKLQEQIRILETEGRATGFELTRKSVDALISGVRLYAANRIEIIFNFVDEFDAY